MWSYKYKKRFLLNYINDMNSPDTMKMFSNCQREQTKIKWLFALLFTLAAVFAANADGLRELDDNSLGLSRKLLAFHYEGLSQYGLLIVGDVKGLQSKNIVVVAHGYHPDPPNYGKIANGQTLRPGDYYRQWINAYAMAGFNVLVPDYRGHNASQGIEYTHQGIDIKGSSTLDISAKGNRPNHPELFYTSDLIAALGALEQQTQNKFSRVVVVGHSMGAPIAFYAAQQIPDQALLVSLWSSAQFGFELIETAPNFVIHHGQNDTVTPIGNAQFYIENFNSDLISFHRYKSAKHMLDGDNFNQAIEIDIALIREAFNAQ